MSNPSDPTGAKPPSPQDPPSAADTAKPGSAAAEAAAASSAASPSGPDEQITRLQAQIAELEAQKADLTDRLLRTVAEMDNIRKRLEREKAETSKYAITRFATDVVALGDNLGHALRSVPAEVAAATPAVKTLLDGVVMTDRAFIASLERHGIKRIDPAGEPFNPHLHQAVQQERNVDVPSGTVLRVLQTGYTLEDRVLRPAAVIVAEGGSKGARAPAQASADGSSPSEMPPRTGGGEDGAPPGP